MKVLLINIILFAGLLNTVDKPIFSTHFIGLSKEEVVNLIPEKHRSLKLNTANINKEYNYLKYEDGIKEITVLFFLADDNKCKAIRMMSDYSNINDVVQQLEDSYLKVTSNTWEYKNNGKKFRAILEEGDWFFTVSIKEIIEN